MNHFALGVPARWFFEYLGGIKIIEPGSERILLEPTPAKEIRRLRVSHNSPKGLIMTEISYDAERDEFTYSYSIPEGVIASVRLPGAKVFTVSERNGSFAFSAEAKKEIN